MTFPPDSNSPREGVTPERTGTRRWTIYVCPECGDDRQQLAHGRCIRECRDENGIILPRVPVEVVPAAVDERQAAIDKALSLMRGSEYVGGPTVREAWRGVLEALGPFETHYQARSAPSTGEAER